MLWIIPSEIMEDLTVNTPLLILAIRNKHDIVQARQRIRQTTKLLDFDTQEQTTLASTAFEIACNLRRGSLAGEICLHVERDELVVVAHLLDGESVPPEPQLRLQRPLPAKALNFTTEDLAWAIVELE